MQRRCILYVITSTFISTFLLWHFALQCNERIFLNTTEDYVPTTTSTTPSSSSTVLPTLTLDDQDAFYGFGCKESRYRKKLQVILQEWVKLAERRNITQYFISFGSLLGSVRNGDLIPYDTDLDVCMFRHDYWKLDLEEAKRPVNLDDGKVHLLLQRHSPRPMSNTPRKDCKGNTVRRVTDDCAILDPHGRMFNGAFFYMDVYMVEEYGVQLWDEYSDVIHNRTVILPVKPCRFLGLDTKCPNSADKFLIEYYGKDYMTPHRKCKGGKWQ